MSNLTASIAELRTLVSQAEAELQSLLAGKKASAPRVRASLQKIKTLSHSMRSDVMAHVKALPVNSRAKKIEPVEDETPPPPPVLEREVTEAPEPVKKPKRVRKKTIKQEATE